jgi:dTMP kinase
LRKSSASVPQESVPREPKPPLSYYRTALPGVDYSELQGKLIVIEGPDAVGRSTQVLRLKAWLEEMGHAVLDTGMARSELASKGIKGAKRGNTLGPLTMTLFYATDFADRLENEIIPALRAGFVVITDRYIFSIMARAISRNEDRAWLERIAGIALVPHAVYYLRADVKDLIRRVVVGKGAFDYWESGLDVGFGPDMFESFVRYQSKLIHVFDQLSESYGFEMIDARQSADQVFHALQTSIMDAFQAQRDLQDEAATPKPVARATATRNDAATTRKAFRARASG